MIIETILTSGLIKRASDSGVKIRNIQTQAVYDEAIDLTNEERIARGFAPYEYEETDEPITPDEPIEDNGGIL